MTKTCFPLVLLASVFFFACGDSATNSNNTDSTTMSDNTTPTLSNADRDTTATLLNSGTDTTATMATSGPVTEMDKQFMLNAAAGGNTEIAASKIALDRSDNDRIKQFANMMVTDHSKAGDELKQIAGQKNVMLPDSVLPPQHQELQTLRTTSARNFNSAYISAMVKGHRGAVDLFENGSKNCENSDVKAFASKTLPVIKMHLDSIMAIQKSM